MLPVVGPITPYRRLCGSAVLLIAAALAPNVHFAVSLLFSSDAARRSIWALFGLYLPLTLLPSARRISNVGSLIALVVACVLAALSMGFTNQIRQAVAASVGFSDDTMPWVKTHARQGTWTYRNPTRGTR